MHTHRSKNKYISLDFRGTVMFKIIFKSCNIQLTVFYIQVNV